MAFGHPRPALSNRIAKKIFALAATIFLALFVMGVDYELTGRVFGHDAEVYRSVLDFGVNNGLTYCLVCITMLYLLIRCYTLDILLTQDGANILLKVSIMLSMIWLFNLVVRFFTDYFRLQILILLLALLFFLTSLLVRQLSEAFDRFANSDGGSLRIADLNVPQFFSFVDHLIRSSRQK